MKLFHPQLHSSRVPNIAAGAFIFIAAVLRAAEPVPLETLVSETVAKNPELKFYEAEIAAAKGGRMTAGEWANPELSAELGGKFVRDLAGNKIGSGPVWSVSLAQTFEFPGRINLRKAIANRQIELAQLGLEQFRAALAARARTLGYQVLAAQQRAEAAREVAKRFQDLLDVLVQRDTAGVAPMLETRIIEASAFTLNRRASEAIIAARNARFELNQLRGLPVSTPVEVARKTIPLKTPPALEILLATARQNNFEIRARIAELEQQGLRVQLHQNERWPSITVAPYAKGERHSEREREFGLGVRVPLPLANRNEGSIATAKARETQAEVSLNVALRDVERKVAAQLHTYDTFVAALAGQVVGIAIEGNRRREIVVRMPEALRADDEQIKRLPLRVGQVGMIRLGQVVEFTTLKTVEPINRDDGQRRAALMVNLSVRDVEGYVHEAERRIKEQVQLPANYIVEFGGQFKNLQEARTRLMVVVPSALLLIFILIFIAFGSLRQALIIYSGIPLAVTGGVAALWLRDMPFSITAAVGFIALSGVAVLNGLVLVTYFNQLREEGHAIRDAVLEGSFTRLRPVLMTALVASLGFVPMAIATGAGAEVQRPLATVVIGGIISSTLLTLIVLPVLYYWFENRGGHAAKTSKVAEPQPAAV